jgi:hypothetical protein
MRLSPTSLLLAALLSLSQCKKHDSGPTKPEDLLPPATQTGAGTFGCLLNGQPWTPQGYSGTPNFITTYDAGYHNGTLQVKCYRYSSSGLQGITFGATNVIGIGTYPFPLKSENGVSYLDNSKTAPCDIWNGNSTSYTYQAGSLTLTRFDMKAGVISGTFQFRVYKLGCDTLNITQGRFDYTL